MAPPVEKYLARFDGASQTIEDCIESLLPEKAALPLKKVAIISTATRAFVELKSASRTACLAIRDARQSLEAREAALDERHLELQNLLYRRHRLLDEVASCRDYKCDGIAQIKRDDADVSADFLSQFATPAMACDVSDSVHESRLATLALELEARTSSSKQLAGTVERKKALDADLSRKSAALQTLPALLAAVKKAAKPLRDVQLEAGPKSKRLKADSGDDVLEAEPDLPRPLYVLYAQLIAARASVFGNDATVEIVGGAEFSAGGLTRLAKSVALSVSSARGNTRVAFYHVAPLDVVCVECWRAGVKDAAFLAGLFPDSHTQLSAAASHAVLQHNLDAAVATGAGGTWPVRGRVRRGLVLAPRGGPVRESSLRPFARESATRLAHPLSEFIGDECTLAVVICPKMCFSDGRSRLSAHRSTGLNGSAACPRPLSRQTAVSSRRCAASAARCVAGSQRATCWSSKSRPSHADRRRRSKAASFGSDVGKILLLRLTTVS